jgi:4-hydroxybenzoate polyprenyltransferase
MAFWISVAVVAYVLIGFAFAVGFYIQEDGDRNDSEIMFDVFVWPMVLAAVVALLIAMGTRKIGNWIIKKKEA